MEITLRAPDRPPPPSARPPLVGMTPDEVAALRDELVAYHAACAPLFQRAEQRHWALKYLEGQLLPLERTSIEPLADALVGGNVQAMQQFISLGAWDDDAVLARHQQLVAEALGDPATGVLIVDGCDFPKQGVHSVGVARQWCGALGKVANCQASVVACYASARGFTLVDRRLSVPEDWFADTSADRRTRCGVPADLAFQTRTELAWAMIAGLRARQPAVRLGHGRRALRQHAGAAGPDRGRGPGLLHGGAAQRARLGGAPADRRPPGDREERRPAHAAAAGPGRARPGAGGRAGGRPAGVRLAGGADPGGQHGAAAGGGRVRARGGGARRPARPGCLAGAAARAGRHPRAEDLPVQRCRRYPARDAGLAAGPALAGGAGHQGGEGRTRARPRRGAGVARLAPPHHDDAAGPALPRPAPQPAGGGRPRR